MQQQQEAGGEVGAALRDASALFGSQAALAGAIGLTPQNLSQFVNGVRPLPLGLGCEIEKVTLGRIRVERLCPEQIHVINYLSRRFAISAERDGFRGRRSANKRDSGGGPDEKKQRGQQQESGVVGEGQQ